jgi:hypothetical protein
MVDHTEHYDPEKSRIAALSAFEPLERRAIVTFSRFFDGEKINSKVCKAASRGGR